MKAYITLDYELAMGNVTGTPEKCLIEPMNHLTAMLDKYGIKVNVFVDAAYLLQMRFLKNEYPRLQDDYEIVTNHIKQLDREGHAIQLHLHPQWCYSLFDGEKWILDKDHYKLQDMPLKDQRALIMNGVELLNSLSSRRVTSFRAGGYCLENFSELYDTFLSAGIKNDSSVVKGEFREGKYHTYDYRNVPSKTPYRIGNDLKRENPEGGMYEYRISTIEVPALFYLLNKYRINSDLLHIKETKQIWGDGVGIGYPGNRFQILWAKLAMLLGKRSICAYIEVGNDLEKLYQYYKKHYSNDDFVMIGHPKILSPYAISVLDFFISNHPDIQFELLS